MLKYIGAIIGMFIARLPGAIIGYFVGAGIDHFAKEANKNLGGEGFADQNSGAREKIFSGQGDFFIECTFAVLGHVSKSKGLVTEADIALANEFMNRLNLNAMHRAQARSAFNKGKSADFPLKNALRQLRLRYAMRPQLLQIFLELQFMAAANDGQLHPEEGRILMTIASELGLSQAQFEALLANFFAYQHFEQNQQRGQGSRQNNTRHYNDDLSDAYKILGVSENSTRNEVKKAYHRLMREHHPDRLMSQDVPEEVIKLATQKTQQIQAAYQLIRKHKSW